MKLQRGTVFSYMNKENVFIATGESDFVGANWGYSPKHSNNCLDWKRIKILNDSYILSGMSLEDIYKDYTEQHNKIAAKLQEEANNKLLQQVYAIKPKEIKKEWQFNSHYTPSGFKITVKKIGNTKEFKIGAVLISDNDVAALSIMVNQTIGGFSVNKDTMKIHDIIGSTSTIREAVKYYYSL